MARRGGSRESTLRNVSYTADSPRSASRRRTESDAPSDDVRTRSRQLVSGIPALHLPLKDLPLYPSILIIR